MAVYLVGAGPGNPDLITVRGAELLRRADVVVHDRLLDQSVLDLAPAAAERIDVGKKPGQSQDQESINAILVDKGKTNEVVRLKGGDPFVFGRGGEEAIALKEAGIRYEVVPGITSAISAPAYAGIPVTHRGIATSFTVVTGHGMSGEPDVDWDALGRVGGTIIVLMGVSHRGEIAKRLIASGRTADTPVAAVRWGTFDKQVKVQTTLGELGETEIEPPSTIVIGPVAGLELNWFSPQHKRTSG